MEDKKDPPAALKEAGKLKNEVKPSPSKRSKVVSTSSPSKIAKKGESLVQKEANIATSEDILSSVSSTPDGNMKAKSSLIKRGEPNLAKPVSLVTETGGLSGIVDSRGNGASELGASLVPSPKRNFTSAITQLSAVAAPQKSKIPRPKPRSAKGDNVEESDDDKDSRLRAFEDMTNLFHSHDAATSSQYTQPGLPPAVPYPYMQGPESSKLALARQLICTPSLFKIFKEPIASTNARFRWNSLTASDVAKQVLSTLPLLKFGKIPDVEFNNVDGRITRPVLGAMGGEPGEFILALGTFEKAAGVKLSDFQIATFLSDFLLQVKKPTFAFHTDTATLEAMCRDFKFCLPENRIDDPPRQMFEFLLGKLTMPKYVGSAHLRHILEQPDGKFHVRKALVSGFIKAFFKLLWGIPINTIAPRTLLMLRSKLRVQVMQGPHTEGAILRVDSSSCAPNMIPMMIPEFNGISLAIIHETAVLQARKILTTFIVEQVEKMGLETKDIIDEDILAQQMNDIGEVQYKQALYLDDYKTPVYRLNFPAACCGGRTVPLG